eukprot:15474549-Alexandrium_andersonii.AAC.1
MCIRDSRVTDAPIVSAAVSHKQALPGQTPAHPLADQASPLRLLIPAPLMKRGQGQPSRAPNTQRSMAPTTPPRARAPTTPPRPS